MVLEEREMDVEGLLYILSPRARGTIYYKQEETPDHAIHHREARWQWERKRSTGSPKAVVFGMLRILPPRGQWACRPITQGSKLPSMLRMQLY